VNAVTVTGSERAGASVAAAAGRALKKSVLELGGSDPFVVLDDVDPALIAGYAAKARFANAGQSCICAKRFIVLDAVAEEFEQHLAAAANDLVVSDPMVEETQMGPMARADLRDSLHGQVADSVAEGARVLAGGAPTAGDGYYYCPPTVLVDVTPSMRVFREETFGPVAAVVRARDEQHAVELANDTAYGLGASVWTDDVARGLRIGRQIRSGSLFVNGIVASDPRLPFGGVKRSGYGRELSDVGMREFVNIRTIWAGVIPVPPLSPEPVID
jgi:acyl-CoA reductase-like NAD-dependent aldehyde dehydrogenase